MATSDITTKTCFHCKKSYPATIEYFGINRAAKDGWYPRCRTCAKIKKVKEILPEGFKRCTKCQALLTENIKNFYLQDASRNKFRASCRACDCRKSQKYHATHREERHLKRISQESRIKDARYRTTHRQEARERNKKWSAANPVVKRALRENYRARKAAGGEHTAADIRLLMKSQQGLCWWCGKPVDPKKYHVDHRIPLSRGGSNNPDNLCITCPTCNLSKNDKLPYEWNGRLL